jgi:hypothetical protein
MPASVSALLQTLEGKSLRYFSKKGRGLSKLILQEGRRIRGRCMK